MKTPSMNVERTHDHFCSNENPAVPSKQPFVNLAELVERFRGERGDPLSIVDGCATNASIAFLKTRFPEDDVRDVEHMSKLIEINKRQYPGVSITQRSVLDPAAFPPHSHEVVTLLGVLIIFDLEEVDY